MLKLNTPVIETLDNIVAIEGNAQIVTLMRAPSPFMSPEWLCAWLQTYSPKNATPRIVVARVGDDVLGLLPLLLTRDKGASVLRFIGAGSICPDYMTLAASERNIEEIAEAVAAEIMSWDDWDSIHFEGVAQDDENVIALARQLEAAGCMISRRSAYNCWRLNIPGSIDEYLQGVSKNHRKKARRKLKKIESGEFAAHHVTDEDTLKRGLDVLKDLHQRRRNSLGEPGCFQDPRFEDLLWRASESALARNGLRLFWFEHDEQPIAAEFSLVENQTVFAYQSGISPEHLHLEPGNLCNLWHIVQATQNGQTAIDFLRGDEPYKAQLGASPVPHCDFRISSPKLVPKLKHQAIDLGLRVRDFITPLVSTSQY